MNALTPEQALAIRARVDALRAYLGKRTSYTPAEVAHLNPPTNDELSALELFEFMRDKPARYFLYIKETAPDQLWLATTWTGERLGHVVHGREYRDNLGGVRVPVTVRAGNGCTYHGTYFKSAGNYARVRKAKHA
jgi:hypothetical protein